MTDTRKLFFPSTIKTRVDGDYILFRQDGIQTSVQLPKKDDYLIMWQEEQKTKKFLAKVLDIKNKKVKIILENTAHLDEPVIDTFGLKHIILNLGPSPNMSLPPIYGVKMEKFYGSFKTKMGKLDIFRQMEKSEIEKLIKTINIIYKSFNKAGLPNIFPLSLHVRESKGKWAGSYKVDPKNLDLLTLHPKTFFEINLQHLIWHELGHGLQINFFLAKQNTKWLRSFVKYTKLIKIDQNSILSLRSDYITHGEDVYDILQEEDQELMYDILQLIKSKMNFEDDDLALLQKQRPTIIEECWPDSAMLSNREDVITEYASTNMKEYFCESLAAFMVPSAKIDMPDSTRKLVKKTLKFLTGL